MFVAGVGIPIMAALNSGLGSRLQSSALATVILFSVGLVIAITFLIASEGLPTTLLKSSTPWYYHFGGAFVMFYILTITWVAPRFGVSDAISFVLLGQLCAMSVIDHFGLFDASKYALDTKRVIGLIFMAIGVFLVLSKK
jgi:transporter family-2 protein